VTGGTNGGAEMWVSDRAAAAAPYLRAVLEDREVQDALRRVAGRGRDAIRRARGQSPGKAVKDKRLRRRAQQAAAASWELLAAIEAAQTPRRPRRGRRLMLVLTVIAGAYGAYLVSNADGREALRGLFTNRDASSQSSRA
jgi:hypothetical protein